MSQCEACTPIAEIPEGQRRGWVFADRNNRALCEMLNAQKQELATHRADMAEARAIAEQAHEEFASAQGEVDQVQDRRPGLGITAESAAARLG